MDRPDTHYVPNGDFSLAYQVFGDGPADLVYLPGWAFNVEGNWEVPEVARFLERLASFTRVVVMDRRGCGCSERLAPGEAATLEEMVDDLEVVTKAARCRKMTLFAVQESAFIAMLAAAAHPDRFERLILFGATPSYRRSEELPWQWGDKAWEEVFAEFPYTSLVSLTEGYVRSAAPSLIGDPMGTRRLATLSALCQPPGAGEAEVSRFSQVDLRALLPVIAIPTLILHRTNDPTEPIESGRFLAERIPNATLIELPGEDALPWIGETNAVLDEIELAVTGSPRLERPASVRTLATVLFTDIVGSTQRAAEIGDGRWRELLEEHDHIVRRELERYRGREIATTGDGFLATFDGPARAIECARVIAAAVHHLGIEIRAGLHTGEVQTISGKVGGIAVHIGARVASKAGASEVLVTQTVKDLVAGSGLVFEDTGEHELKGVPDRWHLYRVADEINPTSKGASSGPVAQ